MPRKTEATTSKATAEQVAESDALESQITQDAAEGERIKNEARAASKTPVVDRDEARQAAHDAEIARQRDVEDAVRAANASELPALGGPELNPGNPGLSED